jgi:hypothetical protein
MEDDHLTDDEHLRAVAALEAITTGNDANLAALTGPGERPLPDLLARYGEDNLHRILLTMVGIDASTGPHEMPRLLAEMNSTQQAQLVYTLTSVLRQTADHRGADLETAKIIGTAVLRAIGTFIDVDDIAVVLRALRAQVLQRG